MAKHNPRTMELIVIHHGATRPNATWKTIHAMHLLKFKMFSGYHWIVERDGLPQMGRRWQYQGAHAPPNANRLGVCILGWNEIAAPHALSRDAVEADWQPDWAWTPKQINSTVHILLPFLIQVFPEAMICGHNQTKSTLCPGVSVPDWLMDNGWQWPERLLHGSV